MKTELSPADVIVIEIGQPHWRRWMIFHRALHRYWSKGRWRRRRRDGDLWNNMAEPQIELQFAQINWQAHGIEDE